MYLKIQELYRSGAGLYRIAFEMRAGSERPANLNTMKSIIPVILTKIKEPYQAKDKVRNGPVIVRTC